MGSFLVAFAALNHQQLVGLALGSRWGRPSPLALLLPEQVGPPQRSAPQHRLPREPGPLGLQRDAKGHQVRDAELICHLAMCRGRPQDRSCVFFDLAFGGLAQAWGRRL